MAAIHAPDSEFEAGIRLYDCGNVYLSVRPNQQPAANASRSWLLTFLVFTTFGFLNSSIVTWTI